mgnify:CR=1 FL=1
MYSEDRLKPTVRGGKIVDYHKYILETPDTVKQISKYLRKQPIYIVGRSGTHLLGWCLHNWTVGKIKHISKENLTTTAKRQPYVFVVENVGSIEEMDTLPHGIIVETYRNGFKFGVRKVIINV